MTKPYKKKLIEVAIPLEAINKASAREKSIRHGHPSTLHLWWARRPLAACRAVLFAQLVDDPSSHPEKFPTEEDQEKERERLFKIMEELVLWENSTNEEVLQKARKEIEASCDGKLPPVYDPFSGGCSIPLEAQRLGLPAYGSDLNPVAVMIGKAMIEIPPKFKDMSPVHPGGPERNHYRYAEGLAEDVRYYGQWMRDRTFERIGHLYPQVELPKDHGGGHANVIAWIWARTVASPDPAFQGAHVPLVSSFLLSAYKGREAIVKPIVDKKNRSIEFTISAGPFTAEEINKARLGTKAGKAQDFICLLSGSPVTRAYIREEGKAGRLGVRLVAVVAEGKGGRAYCPPDSASEAAAASLDSDEEIKDAREGFLSGNTPTRATITGGVCSAYGLSTWGKLFSNRQLRILLTLSQLFSDLRREVERAADSAGMTNDKLPLSDGGAGAKAYADSISIYLSFALGRLADRGSTICSWDSSRTILRNTFGRQGLPMTWDYAEGNPFSNSTGNWSSCCDWVWKVIENFVPSSTGSVTQQDAQTAEIEQGAVISSDPPYYDNIAYSVLSDFFFSWLRLVLKEIDSSLFAVLETPKSEELVAIPVRHGGKEGAEQFFIDGMSKAVGRMAERSSNAVPATIYYAFKQSEIKEEGISSTGWATFLQAVVEAGFAVVGTWPMRTEMTNRMVAAGTNALANSVVLVCRRREIQAEEITRAEFIRALKQELPPALHELQKANITPVDMPQASIGPGIGIFSRYKRVLESDDSPMTVKTALQIINRELDEFLTQQEGEFDVDTRFAVSWFEQNGMDEGSFGDADNLARARGLSVDSVRHAGIVKSAAGKVRLLKRDELERDWSPANDAHLTIWECTQYLIHALENEGEYAAAVLLKQMTPETIDAARDLAYRLHDICSNKRKDAKEATAYNSLIAVWPDLTAQAATISDADIIEGQLSML